MCATAPVNPNPRMVAKAARIEGVLKSLYPIMPSGFLDHHSPYTLLISVLLSAQSTDVIVNKVTPALFKVAPTPEKMIELGEAKIREKIHRIGLAPRKAKNIFNLSKMLVENHDSAVPDTFEHLEALPGVGHKTAGVVMLQAFGKPAFPVDTHIHRLACRWGCGHPKSVPKTEEALKKWFPEESSWSDLHLRLIQFGRDHCPARKHDMDACPICCFAATDEARSFNEEFANKFVGSPTHADPYLIRDVKPIKRELKEDEMKGQAVLEGSFSKKRKRRPTIKSSNIKKALVKDEPQENTKPQLRRSKRPRRKVVKKESVVEDLADSDDDFTP